MREKQADCMITIGGGSLIDGAKIIILVSDLESVFISLNELTIRLLQTTFTHLPI
jgi:alcohol dehydrogenase class IV